ncbi:hypothetical protein [Micromonospora sp. NPDC005367]
MSERTIGHDSESPERVAFVGERTGSNGIRALRAREQRNGAVA